MKDLPTFRKSHYDYAENYAQQVFGDAFQMLSAQTGDYFRVLFLPSYFVLQDDRTEPSKSQWNTLKKRMRRINPQVFVFKAHGETQVDEQTLYYMDFGFLND